MTPETEARIRRLAADSVSIKENVHWMHARNLAGMPLNERQDILGDIKVAERQLYETEAELNELTMSRREVEEP